MKILAMLGFGVTFLAFSQNKGAVVQHAGDCSVNITGNGSTASIVCRGVDPTLAKQVQAILNGRRRSEKAAKDSLRNQI